MLRHWLTPEELTMYQLRGYEITMVNETGAGGGTYGLFECTLDGNLHREDGPAYMCLQGTNLVMVWYQHGKIHREDWPAIVRPDGDVVWYQHGKFHREDGPAVVWSEGTMGWYQDDKPHREDGPALIWDDGTPEWWLNGRKYPTREGWEHELEKRRGSC